MKDPVKEFEDLNNRIEKLFEASNWLSKLHPKNWLYRDKPQSGQQNGQYTRSSAVEKHLANVDAKKSDLGKYNNRFTSEPGSSEAFFYDKSGKRSHVKDITPFIENAGITKATLRTYDLKKDPMKIGWLFDGNFEAELLDWNKSSKKVVFKGKWFPTSSKFMGINYDQAENAPTARKIEFKYFIKKADKEYGPFSSNDIVQSIKNKTSIKGFKNLKVTLDTIIRPTNSANTEFVKDDKFLTQKLQQITKPAQVPKQTPLNNKYFILSKGKETGPFTASAMIDSFKKGLLNVNTIVRGENSNDYEKISDNKTLSYFISSLNKAVSTKKPAAVKPAKPFVKPPTAKRTLNRKKP